MTDRKLEIAIERLTAQINANIAHNEKGEPLLTVREFNELLKQRRLLQQQLAQGGSND
jgi:hypothetical protein